ncbi:MBL fold metallo-hydrolase [archaeon]|nr:MBL fold metallo-hydrolase [archaeon]
MIEICTVGGYSEVGQNMTAIRYKDEVVILDMGLELDSYIRYKGEEEVEKLSKKELINIGAIPDDNSIKDWKNNVVAIIPSHGHLDHIGAIPFMAKIYDCPIICSPYTAEIIKRILEDKRIKLPNQINSLDVNGTTKISDNITIEFVSMTHSIPDTVMVVIHTPEEVVIYGNDFKLDDTPTLGQPPNYKRLKEIGDNNPKLLILDSLYSWKEGKTPSEKKARDMLEEALVSKINEDKGIIITTFSSHIARLRSIVEFGKAMGRKVVFLGRSMAKYCYAAEDIGIVNFTDDVKICRYKRQVQKELNKIDKEGRENYIIVATGHQGEPEAILSRITNGEFGYEIFPEDNIIFSCSVIPSSQSIKNRKELEEKLQKK